MKEINLNQEELKELIGFYSLKEKKLEERAQFLKELINTLKNSLYERETSKIKEKSTSDMGQIVKARKLVQNQEKVKSNDNTRKKIRKNTLKRKGHNKPEPAKGKVKRTINNLKTTENKQVINMKKNGQSAAEKKIGPVKQAADSFERFSSHSTARYDFVKDTLFQKDTLLSDSDFALILFERYSKIIQQPAMAKSVMKELLSEMVHKKKMINKVYFPKLKTTFYGLNAWFSKEGKVKNQYLNKLNVA